MNEHFVCVKVDREERPDVDAIYMDAVLAMTGRRMADDVFLTPDGQPFFGGTYFPPSRGTGCRRSAGARGSPSRGTTGARRRRTRGHRARGHLRAGAHGCILRAGRLAEALLDAASAA